MSQEIQNNNIVSCAGSDCDLCSFMEVLSNGYNFFLAVSFAIAVLFVIFAGASFLMSGGNRNIFKKSKLYFKETVIGFSAVLLGWIIIHSLISFLGFQNAGSWWSFNCNELNPDSSNEATGGKNSSFENWKKYKDLEALIKSKASFGLINGPSVASIFLDQLKELKEGDVINFLSPVRVESINGSENLLTSLLSLRKEGDGVEVENFGEYWEIIKNNWPEVKKTAQEKYLLTSEEINTLDKYLGVTSYTDNRYLVDTRGEVASNFENEETRSLYSSLAEILGDLGNDNTQTEPSSDQDLANLLAQAINASSGEGNQSEEEEMIAILLAETLKMASLLGVEIDENEGNVSIAKSRCEMSGGTWDGEYCDCQEEMNLGEDLKCHFSSDQKENCGKSGGDWVSPENKNENQNNNENFDSGSIFNDNENENRAIKYCGEEKRPQNFQDFSEGIRYLGNESGYCFCPEDRCLDSDGYCRKEDKDDDEDGINNEDDKCPDTPEKEKNSVNKKSRSQYYGCSCSQMQDVRKKCPENRCEGDYYVIYPSGRQECKNGELKAYSCQPLQRSFSDRCYIQGNSNINANNNLNTNTNNNNNSNTSSGSGSGSGSGKIDDDFSKEPPGGDKVPPGDGNDGSNTERGKGDIESIKKALRRIEEKDPLRYEMIMRFVRTIKRTAFPGGLCYGCGYIEVNASLPIGIIDQVITHEATHSAHACVSGWGGFSTAEVERIACANTMGSTCRVQDHKDMKEFIRQREGITYMGKELRGYVARRQTKASPKGDLGTAAFHWSAAYALSYGDRTMGPFHYGDHDSKILLGLKDKEETVIKKAMESQRNCFSKPTSDLPPVKACENAQRVIDLK